jgi:hypothetical protein
VAAERRVSCVVHRCVRRQEEPNTLFRDER